LTAGRPGSAERTQVTALVDVERDASWETAGPEGGPALVFIHGAVMTRALWRAQVERLARAGYRCISVDLPGHGALAGRPFTLEGAADLVCDVVDRAAGGRAVLIGLSLGGYVAMTVAGRSPERVRGLVLAGSTREPAGSIRAAFTLVGWSLKVTPEPVLRGFVSELWRRRYGREVAATLLANGYYAKGGSLAIRRLPGGRFRERLAAYGGPILVINGDLDVVFRLGERRFLEGLPGVTRLVLHRAAHLSNLDRPDEFSGAIEGFAASLAP
jgi:pimeloyl-ACP methyl ester carboxylesterase